MSKLFTFFLNILLFIPRLMFGSLAGFFKMLLLLIIIGFGFFFWGKQAINKFLSPSNNETSHSIFSK